MISKYFQWVLCAAIPLSLCAQDMRSILEELEFMPLKAHLCPLIGIQSLVLGPAVRSKNDARCVVSQQYLIPPYERGCRYMEIKDPHTGVVYCKYEAYNPEMEPDVESRERDGGPQLVFFDSRSQVKYGKTARGTWIVFVRKPWRQEHRFRTRQEAIELVRRLGIPD